MAPKKTPSQQKKRTNRPSSSPGHSKEGASDSLVSPQVGQVSGEGNVSRERSASKRRRILEQQQKITNFTDRQETKNQTEGEQEDIVVENSDSNITLATILTRMEKGMDDGRKQNDRLGLQLEKILSELFDVKKENDLLKKKIDSLQKSYIDLHDDVSRLEKELKQEKELRNSLEQYSRKDNIKVTNLPGDSGRETAEETEGKVVDLFKRKLELTSFQHNYISVAHRVGKYTVGRNRPVIVRLVNRKIKSEIFKRRRLLKQNKINIYVTEDLTKLNAQRLYDIKHHPAVLSAWSFQGKLYCKLLDLKIIQIENGDMNKIERALLETSKSDDRSQPSSQLSTSGGSTEHRRPREDNRADRASRKSGHTPVQSRLQVHSSRRRLQQTGDQHHRDRSSDGSGETSSPPGRALGSVPGQPRGDGKDGHGDTASPDHVFGEVHQTSDSVPVTFPDALSGGAALETGDEPISDIVSDGAEDSNPHPSSSPPSQQCQ